MQKRSTKTSTAFLHMKPAAEGRTLISLRQK